MKFLGAKEAAIIAVLATVGIVLGLMFGESLQEDPEDGPDMSDYPDVYATWIYQDTPQINVNDEWEGESFKFKGFYRVLSGTIVNGTNESIYIGDNGIYLQNVFGDKYYAHKSYLHHHIPAWLEGGEVAKVKMAVYIPPEAQYYKFSIHFDDYKVGPGYQLSVDPIPEFLHSYKPEANYTYNYAVEFVEEMYTSKGYVKPTWGDRFALCTVTLVKHTEDRPLIPFSAYKASNADKNSAYYYEDTPILLDKGENIIRLAFEVDGYTHPVLDFDLPLIKKDDSLPLYEILN